MNLEIKKLLFDIKTSIDSLLEYLGEKRDFREYQNNKLLRRAVERELEIIGEAASRILKLDDKVDDVIIWGIISSHIPKLKSQVNDLLGK